jgi:hypothetical protein
MLMRVLLQPPQHQAWSRRHLIAPLHKPNVSNHRNPAPSTAPSPAPAAAAVHDGSRVRIDGLQVNSVDCELVKVN